MHQEKYWASKVPVPLALLFLLNVFLVIAGELLFWYKYPVQPDAATLARYDSAYSDCTVFNRDSISGLTASLVETVDGQTHLVVTKGHSIAYGRGKIIYAEPVEMPESGELTVFVKNGIHTSEIAITEIVSGGTAVTIHYGYSGTFQTATTWYMVTAALLEAIELMVVYIIKKNFM